jgi:hypothetical protein
MPPAGGALAGFDTCWTGDSDLSTHTNPKDEAIGDYWNNLCCSVFHALLSVDSSALYVLASVMDQVGSTRPRAVL